MRAAVPAALFAALAASAAHAAPPAGGAAIYAKKCAVCHQSGGVGVAGSFPRLAGRTPILAASPAGRRLLILTVLHGMAGKLQTPEGPVVGAMPAQGGALSDAEVADVLSYTGSLGGAAKAFTAAEVAAVRAEPKLKPGEVNALAKTIK